MGFPEPACRLSFLPQGSARRLHWTSWPMSSGRSYYPISFPCSRDSSSTLSGWSRSQASWCWVPSLRVSAPPACLCLTSDPCADVRRAGPGGAAWGSSAIPEFSPGACSVPPNNFGISMFPSACGPERNPKPQNASALLNSHRQAIL